METEIKLQILAVVASALVAAPVVTGITEAIKKNTGVEGLGVIITALITALALFGGVALVYGYPMGESLLTGLLAGFASIGAFEGIEQLKDLNINK